MSICFKTTPRNSSLAILDDIFLPDITSDDTVVTSNTSTDTLFPTSSVDPTFIHITRCVDKVSCFIIITIYNING
jgi:hypothetical protein